MQTRARAVHGAAGHARSNSLRGYDTLYLAKNHEGYVRWKNTSRVVDHCHMLLHDGYVDSRFKRLFNQIQQFHGTSSLIRLIIVLCKTGFPDLRNELLGLRIHDVSSQSPAHSTTIAMGFPGTSASFAFLCQTFIL